MDEGEFRTKTELYPTLSYLGIEGEITLYDATLDLDDSTTDILDTATVDQTYTATVNTPKTDKTKVQVSWKLEDITATVTKNKVWDTEKLQWVSDTSNPDTSVASAVSANFDFVNLSSERLIGKVQFDVNTTDGFTEPESIEYTDKAVALLTKAEDANCDNKNSITVDLQANGDDFSEKSGKGTYGTYTVSIKEPDYLTFKATEANSTVTPNFLSGSWEYSTDNGITWEDGTNYTYSGEGEIADESKVTKITLANVNDTVKLRGDDCVTGWDNYDNCLNFSMTGKIVASGDVTSLTNEVGDDATLADYCYTFMFFECESLEEAPTLPSTIMASGCYDSMFNGCTSLTQAPELPATTLAYDCYVGMFANCSSLTQAPELPATTLAYGCYGNMFEDCSSLTQVPELPATTLAEFCYSGMFYDCSLLTQAPELPATTLACGCYLEMFMGCQDLKVTTTKPATGTEGTDWGIIMSGAKTLENKATNQMFDGCAVKPANTPTTFNADTTYYWYK